MANSKRKSKSRNPFHDHPLMRKGGIHEKTNKQKRKGVKQKWKKEWCSLIAVKQLLTNTSQNSWGYSSMGRASDCRSGR